MKKIVFGFAIFTLILASCGTDCELTELDEIIIGDWSFRGKDISFNADGTMDDPDNAFETSVNGFDLLIKSWSLEADTVLIIRCASDDPPFAISTNFLVESYDCNEIKANSLLTFTFRRKWN